jgi:ubiquinone biosynthesis monooxygenase Coq7
MLGRNFIYTTIYYVETFVEKHYQEQLNMLEKNEQSRKLRKIIEDLMKDEIGHKDDAKKYLKNLTIFNKLWGQIITHGSNLAVNISKRF